MRNPDDIFFRVRLDDITIARLMELADACHADPAAVIAAITRDVLEDDARAHEDGGFADGPVTLQ